MKGQLALEEIMKKHKTDKVSQHSYAHPYEFHFGRYKDFPIKLFEIGVGGYNNRLEGGCSLRAWKEYFQKGEIFSIDTKDKNSLQEPRITIRQGSQFDRPFLENFEKEFGPFKFIIDDGSHINLHVIESFKILFPLLETRGIYVIEDIQTSYFPEYRHEAQQTTMEYFKRLCDGLNYREQLGYHDHSYLDQNIASIHFYHNIIFVYKGDNTEESNILVNNERK